MKGELIVKIDALVMPYLAKTEISATPEKWSEEVTSIKEMFVEEDIYTVGPIIYTEVPIGLDEKSYITYIPINQEIDKSDFNIEFLQSIELFPTISHKCFEKEEFDEVYQKIRNFSMENNIILKEQPFYHVILEYAGGNLYEIHAEVDLDRTEINE